MSTRNPYEDYDALDPWEEDDEDEDGVSRFVEDEYVSQVGDASGSPTSGGTSQTGRQGPVSRRGGQAPIGVTRTQVRPAYPMTNGTEVRSPEPIYRRRGTGRAATGRVQASRDVERHHYVAREATPPREAPRPAPRRRRYPARLISLMLLVICAVVCYWFVAHPLDERLALSSEERKSVNGTLTWAPPLMPYYVLALGSDARPGESVGRTDTMVLMRVDLIGGTITMVSIPRDTRVEIEGVGPAKIGEASVYGGLGGSIRAVSRLCGVPVHHVAIIRFEQLVDLVNYLGGVTVNVPNGLSDPYTGLTLEAGAQTLDGETALAWVRSRYGLEGGDIERQQDQRILITSIINRLMSLSPTELPGALLRIGDLVGTDMIVLDLLPLFMRMRFLESHIYSCALPTNSAYVDDLWYEIADDALVKRLMDAVAAGRDPATLT